MSACVLVFFSLFATALLISGNAAEARRVALVMGASGYAHTQPLTNPKNDAESMAAVLAGHGFEVVKSVDEPLDEALKSLDRFYKRAEGADAALFFFAGHGLQVDGVNYLMPIDARLRSETTYKKETLVLQDVITAIERRATITLAFVDACRNNPLAEQLYRSMSSTTRSAVVPNGLARMAINSPNTLVVFAAEAGKLASDGAGKNSPFTVALLKHMPEPGLDVELMLKRVTRDVSAATGGGQTPERLSRLTSDFAINATSKPHTAQQDSAPPQRPIAALTKREAEESTQSQRGCRPPQLNTAMDIRIGSQICLSDGQDVMTIKEIEGTKVGYSINGGFKKYCSNSELCGVDIAAGTFMFRVRVNSQADAALIATTA